MPDNPQADPSLLSRISASWARIEISLAAGLAVLITLLILLNVVTRAFNTAIFWVDEAAIYVMIWMTFLAASAAFHYRNAIAVTVIKEVVSDRFQRVILRAVDIVEFVFAIIMVYLCVRWFQPVALFRAGFDTVAFQGATFNFIYAEPTTTLKIPKFWVWSIMWIFSGGALLHSLNNLFGSRAHESAVP